MNPQAAREEPPMFILLRPFQHQDVLVPRVKMQGNLPPGLEPQDRRRRPRHPVAIQPVNLHPRLEGLPPDTRSPLARPGEVKAFKSVIESRLRGGNAGHFGG